MLDLEGAGAARQPSAEYQRVNDHDEDSDKEASAVLETIELEHPVTAPERWKIRDLFTIEQLKKWHVLLPSFLHPDTPETKQSKLHPTAWLDGLRGFAAFFVVWHHMSLIWFGWPIHDAWQNFDSLIITLPILRLVVTGSSQVFVFFVVSGYSLSLKALKLFRQDRYSEAYSSLASSFFRRHPRLFIPPIVICSPMIMVAYLGLYGNGEGIPGAAVSTSAPPVGANLWDQIWHYVHFSSELSDPWARGPPSGWWEYDNALWTLPMEWIGSIFVFGSLMAFSRLTTLTRFMFIAFTAWYSFYKMRWDIFLFASGMIAADLGLQLKEWEDSDVDAGAYVQQTRWEYISGLPRMAWSKLRHRKVLGYIFWPVSYIFCLWLLGMPSWQKGVQQAPGYQILVWLIPQHWHAYGAEDFYWPPIGAFWLVVTVDRSKPLQRIFTNGFAQYLGRISYALYIVHIPLLHSFGFRMGRFFVSLTGSEPETSYCLGVAMATILLWMVIIWSADLGWRFVDAKAVKFAAWIYHRLLKEVPESI